MDFTTFGQLTLYGTVTPADALVAANETVRLGFLQNTLTVPTDADIVYTKSAVITSGDTRAMNMQTLQIATVDATAPRNFDGSLMTLTKIYAIVVKLASTVDNAGAYGIRLTSLVWTHPLDIKLTKEGDVCTLLFGAGITVGASDTVNIIETDNLSDTTVELLIIGKQ